MQVSDQLMHVRVKGRSELSAQTTNTFQVYRGDVEKIFDLCAHIERMTWGATNHALRVTIDDKNKRSFQTTLSLELFVRALKNKINATEAQE